MMGIHKVSQEPDWSVARRVMAAAVEVVGPVASQERQKAVLTQQVGPMLANNFIQFFEKKKGTNQQKTQSLHTCGESANIVVFAHVLKLSITAKKPIDRSHIIAS